jgi:hypothetical protein
MTLSFNDLVSDSTPSAPAADAPASEAADTTTEQVESTSNASLDEAVEAASEDAAETVEEPPKEEPKTFKVKVDGKELDVTLDELQRGYSLERAARTKMEQAAKMRKEADSIRQDVEQFIVSAKKDPLVLFRLAEQLGYDSSELAEKMLADKIAAELMTPEQKLQKQLEAERRRLEDERRSIESERLERETSTYRATFERDFGEALTAAKLPVNTATLARMATHKMAALKSGADLEVGQLAARVREEILAEHRAVLGGLGDDELVGFVGEEQLAKLRKVDIGRSRKAPTPPVVPPKVVEGPRTQRASQSKSKMTFDDLIKSIK